MQCEQDNGLFIKQQHIYNILWIKVWLRMQETAQKQIVGFT